MDKAVAGGDVDKVTDASKETTSGILRPKSSVSPRVRVFGRYKNFCKTFPADSAPAVSAFTKNFPSGEV
ncbi:hypothetical protein E2P81_ATG02187 [Venturia nashicola]|uniref:Uncharacterized protein n=1 Tax=Venturia nashicola TaxID=86259 RepID=A0A4Z1P622_9PEZI|nr:hypothetical protein E6O75_ATG02242 [Venturia nashicola]TLD35884.1 hypothetical protein E2P81_ATG02187 [Venturia nashicola]